MDDNSRAPLGDKTNIAKQDEPAMETTNKESTTGFNDTPVPHVGETCVQRTSKGNYDSERYKNMTPEQREARRERQRLHNTEPKRKEAMKLAKKKFQEARTHAIHSDSIAMENPERNSRKMLIPKEVQDVVFRVS